jgi:hypothetical protein
LTTGVSMFHFSTINTPTRDRFTSPSLRSFPQAISPLVISCLKRLEEIVNIRDGARTDEHHNVLYILVEKTLVFGVRSDDIRHGADKIHKHGDQEVTGWMS